jgi:general secretion pathway protein J
MRRVDDAGEAGFTLIEVLVAVTLLAVLVTLLAGGLRLGFRAWETVEARSGGIHEVVAAQRFVRRALAEALQPAADDPPRAAVFSGAPDRVAVVAPLPAHLGGGLHRLTFALAPGARGRDLVVHLRPFRPRDPEAGPQETFVLLEDVDGLQLAYYAPGEVPGDGSWLGAWPDTEALPALVSMRLTPLGGRRHWPELLVRPRHGRSP